MFEGIKSVSKLLDHKQNVISRSHKLKRASRKKEKYQSQQLQHQQLEQLPPLEAPLFDDEHKQVQELQRDKQQDLFTSSQLPQQFMEQQHQHQHQHQRQITRHPGDLNMQQLQQLQGNKLNKEKREI